MSLLDSFFARFSAMCAISCSYLTLGQQFHSFETLSGFVS